MKRLLTVFLLVLSLVLCLCACSVKNEMNILLFTHRLSEISGEETELSDYIIVGGKYKLLTKEEGLPMLITAEENERGETVKVHLSLSRLDEEGKEKEITSREAELYKKKAAELIYAFTLFEKEKSLETAEKILPLKDTEPLRTGENTIDIENYHLVYYGNKICCRLSVVNTYLEKTEITEKPESRPFYEVTASAVNP